ncbi:MAG: T9SS type A sorting domain-containing protein [Cytophagales bacterium]|nr:T9SS type A sorting domain-containing protein [Cytophagales bacterium]
MDRRKSYLLSITELDFINNLTIHPNPTTGKFIIEMLVLNEVKELQIKLLDIIGQVIYQVKLNKYVEEYQKAINVGALAKGTYNLQLVSGEGIINKKIIVE